MGQKRLNAYVSKTNRPNASRPAQLDAINRKDKKIMKQKISFSLIGLSALGMPFLSLFLSYFQKIERLILIDPDVWQKGQTRKHILSKKDHAGKPKVEVAKELVKGINQNQRIETYQLKAQDSQSQKAMQKTDVIISCVDNDLSRLDLQVFATQHNKTLLDLSAQIIGEERFGTVRLYIPNKTPCLVCQGLPAHEIMSDTLKEAKINTGYLKETDMNPRSVAVLDTEVACIGLSLLISHLEGKRKLPTTLFLDQTKNEIKRLTFVSKDDCKICNLQTKGEINATGKS